jgi:hypothetical protein
VNKLLLLLVVLLLPGCAIPMFIAGVASVGVNESTGRTVSDHVASGATGRDCRIARTFEGRDICQDVVITPQLQVTESQYQASSTAEIQARYTR